MPSLLPPRSFLLYFIQEQPARGRPGPVKIGITLTGDRWESAEAAARRRMRQIQRKIPRELVLRRVYRAQPASERQLHAWMEKDAGYQRLHGEWFEARVLDAVPPCRRFNMAIAWCHERGTRRVPAKVLASAA